MPRRTAAVGPNVASALLRAGVEPAAISTAHARGVPPLPPGFVGAAAETICANMRAERMRAGLTQAELGAAVGVSHQQIAKYESGRDSVTAARLFCIAFALRVPVTRFFRP